MSAAAGEDTLCGRVPRCQSHVPRVTARPVPADGHIHTKAPESPQLPSLKGQVLGRQAQSALPGRGSGVGGHPGKAAQSKVGKERKQENELLLQQGCLAAKPRPRGYKAPSPTREGFSPLPKLLPAPARGAPSPPAPARGAPIAACPGAGGGSVDTRLDDLHTRQIFAFLNLAQGLECSS